MKFEIVPSEETHTLVSLGRPLHCIVMARTDGEGTYVLLKSFRNCVNGITISTSTSLGGEVRAIHRQFVRNEKIRVLVSFDATQNASIGVLVVTE